MPVTPSGDDKRPAGRPKARVGGGVVQSAGSLREPLQHTPNTCCRLAKPPAAPRAASETIGGEEMGFPEKALASQTWEQAARRYRAPLPAPLPGRSVQGASGPGRNASRPLEPDSRCHQLNRHDGPPTTHGGSRSKPDLASPCSPGRVACVKLPNPSQGRPPHKSQRMGQMRHGFAASHVSGPLCILCLSDRRRLQQPLLGMLMSLLLHTTIQGKTEFAASNPTLSCAESQPQRGCVSGNAARWAAATPQRNPALSPSSSSRTMPCVFRSPILNSPGSRRSSGPRPSREIQRISEYTHPPHLEAVGVSRSPNEEPQPIEMAPTKSRTPPPQRCHGGQMAAQLRQSLAPLGGRLTENKRV